MPRPDFSEKLWVNVDVCVHELNMSGFKIKLLSIYEESILGDRRDLSGFSW